MLSRCPQTFCFLHSILFLFCRVPNSPPDIWLWVFVAVLNTSTESLTDDNWARHPSWYHSRISFGIIYRLFLVVLFCSTLGLWAVQLLDPGRLSSVRPDVGLRLDQFIRVHQPYKLKATIDSGHLAKKKGARCSYGIWGAGLVSNSRYWKPRLVTENGWFRLHILQC